MRVNRTTQTTDPVSVALASYAASALAKDADAFVSIYTEDLHVFDMWNQWELRGIDAWRKMAQGWFDSLGEERVVVTFADVTSTVGADLALGHATVTYTAMSAEGKELRSLDNRMTIAMRRAGVSWKIFHEHTSGPLEHQTLKGMIKRGGA
jgi:ketosteroid isomerase-like protein